MIATVTTRAAETPDRDLDRTISHLLSTAEKNAGHLDVHTAAAAKFQGDPALLTHHLRHAAGHSMEVADHLAKLRVAVARRVPGVARELDDLDGAIPGSRSAEFPVPDRALDMSIAHDLSTAQAATSHVSRHLAEAQGTSNSNSISHNLDHAINHIAEINHALSELDADLCRKIPAVDAENLKLHAAIAPAGKTAAGRSAPADYDVTEWRAGPEPA